MAQRRLKGVLLGFAGEVIAARAKVSRAEDHALREFPFHVEVILAARTGTSGGRLSRKCRAAGSAAAFCGFRN